MSPDTIRVERTFPRFTLGQRWEHALLLISGTALLLTGLPQKFRSAGWSQQILSSPERLELVRQIHHISAILLIAVVVYHLGRAIYFLIKRRLPGDMLPTWQDVRDAWQMVKYLLFLSKRKPAASKYNFEEKFTYWFIFVAVGIMVITGIIIWFPVAVTRLLPGGVVPASKLAHSTEATVAALFVIVWHLYHVLVQRLNLSMFTGRISEEEMRTYHSLEYERLTGEKADEVTPGGSQ